MQRRLHKAVHCNLYYTTILHISLISYNKLYQYYNCINFFQWKVIIICLYIHSPLTHTLVHPHPLHSGIIMNTQTLQRLDMYNASTLNSEVTLMMGIEQLCSYDNERCMLFFWCWFNIESAEDSDREVVTAERR